MYYGTHTVTTTFLPPGEYTWPSGATTITSGSGTHTIIIPPPPPPVPPDAHVPAVPPTPPPVSPGRLALELPRY